MPSSKHTNTSRQSSSPPPYSSVGTYADGTPLTSCMKNPTTGTTRDTNRNIHFSSAQSSLRPTTTADKTTTYTNISRGSHVGSPPPQSRGWRDKISSMFQSGVSSIANRLTSTAKPTATEVTLPASSSSRSATKVFFVSMGHPRDGSSSETWSDTSSAYLSHSYPSRNSRYSTSPKSKRKSHRSVYPRSTDVSTPYRSRHSHYRPSTYTYTHTQHGEATDDSLVRPLDEGNRKAYQKWASTIRSQFNSLIEASRRASCRGLSKAIATGASLCSMFDDIDAGSRNAFRLEDLTNASQAYDEAKASLVFQDTHHPTHRYSTSGKSSRYAPTYTNTHKSTRTPRSYSSQGHSRATGDFDHIFQKRLETNRESYASCKSTKRALETALTSQRLTSRLSRGHRSSLKSHLASVEHDLSELKHEKKQILGDWDYIREREPAITDKDK